MTLRVFASNALTRIVTAAISDACNAGSLSMFRVDFGERIIDLGDYDVVLRVNGTNSIDGKRIGAWRHVLVASPSYLRSFGNPEQPCDLRSHACLHYAAYPYGSDWKFAGPNGESYKADVSPTAVSNNIETLRHFAIDGQGLFLAPSFVVSADVAASRLAPAMPDFRGTEHFLHAIVPKRSASPARVADLLYRLTQFLEISPLAEASYCKAPKIT